MSILNLLKYMSEVENKCNVVTLLKNSFKRWLFDSLVNSLPLHKH